MEIGGVGGGATHADALAKLVATPKVSAPSINPAGPSIEPQDTVAGLLEQLTAPQTSNLIRDVEARREELSIAPAGDLLAKAVTATHSGDIPRALSTLAELVHAHPGRAEGLGDEPGLEPIRQHIDSLIRRLTETARADAGGNIESATHLIRTSAHGTSHRAEINPQNVMAVAERLFDSGKYANLVLAADLAQAVIEYYGPYPVAGAGVALRGKTDREIVGLAAGKVGKRVHPTKTGSQVLERARQMWLKAPLLLMLIVWMTAGLLAGMFALPIRELLGASKITGRFFEVWGVGFLGLIGFGFYRSIRRLRFR